jgi:hypothetical protein
VSLNKLLDSIGKLNNNPGSARTIEVALDVRSGKSEWLLYSGNKPAFSAEDLVCGVVATNAMAPGSTLVLDVGRPIAFSSYHEHFFKRLADRYGICIDLKNDRKRFVPDAQSVPHAEAALQRVNKLDRELMGQSQQRKIELTSVPSRSRRGKLTDVERMTVYQVAADLWDKSFEDVKRAAFKAIGRR